MERDDYIPAIGVGVSDALTLEGLVEQIKACRVCVDDPKGKPLPHAPRPVLVASSTAKILIAGQAPGTRVHASGMPFTDPSGDRLRDWLGVTVAQFYNPADFAIVPMGFCFPGLDAKGGDLPPRKECALQWRDEVLSMMPQIELVLAIGGYAQSWHLHGATGATGATVTDTVRDWRKGLGLSPKVIPLPHPSWRNSGWLKCNEWFAAELLPVLRNEVFLRVS